MYNTRLNSSNLEERDDKFEQRAKTVKESWTTITKYFLDKGFQVQFKFWGEDSDSSIQQVIARVDKPQFETDSDGLKLMTVALTPEVKELLTQSELQETHLITPFFHFYILDANGESLFSSQDHGDNTLFYLSEEERAALVQRGLLYEELEKAQWLE